MNRWVYYAGRILQLTGLLVMPSSMWISELQHNEALVIGVFLGSLLIFGLGFVLVRVAKR